MPKIQITSLSIKQISNIRLIISKFEVFKLRQGASVGHFCLLDGRIVCRMVGLCRENFLPELLSTCACSTCNIQRILCQIQNQDTLTFSHSQNITRQSKQLGLLTMLNLVCNWSLLATILLTIINRIMLLAPIWRTVHISKHRSCQPRTCKQL